MKIFLTKLEVGLLRKIFLTILEVGWDMKIYRTKLEVGILPQSLHIYIPMWCPNVRRPNGGAPRSCFVPIAHSVPRHGSATFQRIPIAHPIACYGSASLQRIPIALSPSHSFQHSLSVYKSTWNTGCFVRGRFDGDVLSKQL